MDFEVNENTTIDDVVNMIKSTGLNANFDQESQRIFISSKNTGAANDFTIVANDEGGLNALAALGLLNEKNLASDENKTWAAYKDATGYTPDFYKSFEQEVKKREDALNEANKKMSDENAKLKETNDTLTSRNEKYMDYFKSVDNGDIGTAFKNKTGVSMSYALEHLYGDGGLFDVLKDAQEKYSTVNESYNKAKEAYDAVSGKEDTDQDKIDAKAALDAAQSDLDAAKNDLDWVRNAYTTAQKDISDFVQDTVYGPIEKVERKDKDGNTVKDDDGNIVYDEVRKGGLKKEYDEAKANGTLTQDMQDKVDAINNLNDALRTVEEYKGTLYSNNKKIASNEEKIEANEKYMAETGDVVDNTTMASSELREKVLADCMAKVDAANKSLEAAGQIGVNGTTNVYANMATATKVDAQDAIITIDGAEFTSMTNTFNVNGMTITALEETDKEITMTTSMDTDGIYDMIKNFFTEYNKLINEMDSLYNAESSKGYEPLTSEEKDAMSDDEIEEWEKKIKDSLLRRDSTLSSVSFSMVSILLEGAEVNGKKMYLSDFGINTLGYFKAKDNERNAYHINGDPDDADTKAEDDELRKMIANDPDTVMNFFTKLSNNLYDNLTKQMASTTLSSAFTVYNDKLMKEEYKDYTDRIAKEEEKLNNMMDKWYKKFSAMEVAMSKLESRSSSLASILGG